ncbi:MAG: hypothetical protein ACPGYY_04470, partial [Bacteroidia bacterium]
MKINYSKSINLIIPILQSLTLVGLGIFLIVNWHFISNPQLLPNYFEGQSIFGNGRDNFAKLRNLLFYYPWDLIQYLIYLQSILLIYLLFKKNLIINLRQGLVIIALWFFCIFSDYAFNILSDLFDSSNFREIQYLTSDAVEV